MSRNHVLQPRAHQAEACAAAAEVIQDGGSAMVVMATGTGKTLVGSMVAARVAASRVVVLVPSLALVRQVLADWRRSGWWAAAEEDHGPVTVAAVCSDKQLGRALDLVGEVVVTTDADQLVEHLAGAGGAQLVVGTYQSCAVLVEAGEETGGGLPAWDLVVCDEAHHLAGAAASRSSYSAVVRGEVPAVRRLYMTATPRRWRSDGSDALEVDALARGPIVYDLRLGAAVQAGLAADYQVVVAAADQQVVAEVAGRLPAQLLEQVEARTIAVAVAVACAMRQRGIRRLVSFHSRVGRAHEFSSALRAVVEVLGDQHRPAGQGRVAWVSGGSSQAARQQALDALADPDRSGWVAVANARLLGEGVDLPDLDAVAIVDPRSSAVDVTQAVGRALRARPGKQACVVVPVVTQGDAGQAIDAHGLAAACSVLRALRAHDERLGRRLDEAARQLHREQGYRTAHRRRLEQHLQLDVPGHLSTLIAEAVTIAAVRSAAESFEEAYGLLEAFVEQHGTADVPQDTVVDLAVPAPDGRTTFGLGTWVSRQRLLRQRGQLSVQRQAALEVLEGWTWDAVRSRVEERVDALIDWLGRAGGQRTPPAGTVVDGHNVDQVCNWARTEFARGRLDDALAERLEAADGWVWNQREADWWDHQRDLAAWVEQHGHAQPSAGETAPDGFDLGKWVAKQRVKLRRGELDEVRAAALRGLQGWVDDVLEARWQAQYDALVAWAEQHGHACPAQSEQLEVDGEQVAVGRFVAKQRARWRKGALDDDRAERLQALAGWDWEPGRQRATWEDSLAVLRDWVAEHGHARVGFDAEHQGLALGTWVTAQRTAQRKGQLSASRRGRLEQVDGWVWHPADERWWRRLEQVGRWVARRGGVAQVADVGPGERDRDGWQLGAWWHRQFERLADGRLDDPEQAAALRALLDEAAQVHDQERHQEHDQEEAA